jgi:capsular polysaccharide export protein
VIPPVPEARTRGGRGPGGRPPATRPRHTVAFLSYFGHQSRLFRLIAQALPPEVASKHLSVYALRPRALLSRLLDRGHAPPETLARITLFDSRKRARMQTGTTPEAQGRPLAGEAAGWYRLFRRQLAGADLLVVWSGFRLPLRAAICAAESLAIKTLYCENGVLPGTMAMDPKGVNFGGSITGRGQELLAGLAIDPERERALLGTALEQRPMRRTLRSAGGDTADDRPLPERYVLFPMQVHDDSQVLLFSPRFRNMEQAVRYIAREIEQHNARTDDSLVLVVKEHPSDAGRADYRQLRRSLPDVHFLRRAPIRRIIGHARAVIVLNSSVGVEGLLYMRPVVTLADALYNIPGVVRHMQESEDLADVLPEVIDQPVDRELITRFLYFLRYEYLVPVSLRSSNEETIGPAAQRVMDVLHGRLSWAE